jgi:hypothetical protein
MTDAIIEAVNVSKVLGSVSGERPHPSKCIPRAFPRLFRMARGDSPRRRNILADIASRSGPRALMPN